jgi:hypothetical protein
MPVQFFIKNAGSALVSMLNVFILCFHVHFLMFLITSTFICDDTLDNTSGYTIRSNNKSNSEQIPYEKSHYFEITWLIFKIRIACEVSNTFSDWLKFSLIEELTYEIDVWFQEKFLTNDALDLIGNFAF